MRRHFLYQVFAREFGTNNFPDCSNMCHEATSVGLPQSIGIGKGTVSLDDFDRCELIIAIGHNPGTNHPRMMGTLHECAKRGVPIIVLNPVRERALERFADPQNALEMATLGATNIASDYYQLRVGGDGAALSGIMKALLERERSAGAGRPVFDNPFITDHTQGFEALIGSLDALSWNRIEAISGLARKTLTHIAALYAKSKATIVSYGMGVVQHVDGTTNVQQIANLLLPLRQLWDTGSRHLPPSRAFECSRRSHGGGYGNSVAGAAARYRTSVWLQAAAGARTCGGGDHASHHRGALKGIGVSRGQSPRRAAGPGAMLSGHAKARSGGSHRDEVEPFASAHRQGVNPASLSWPHRNRPASKRPTIGDRGGLHVHGARFARDAATRVRTSAIGARHHRWHRTRDLAREPGQLARARCGL